MYQNTNIFVLHIFVIYLIINCYNRTFTGFSKKTIKN